MELFVYGTLTDPDITSSLLDDYEFGPDAVLFGLRRVEGEYPTLAPGDRVEGRLLRTDEVSTLDRYEGVDAGLYVPVTVPGDDGTALRTYVGDPAKLGLSGSVEWPGTGSFQECVQAYIRSRSPTVVREPPSSPSRNR